MSDRAEPRWLLKETVLIAHARSLADHGGPEGVRDDGLLESALARPRQLAAYGDPPPDIAALAAAYGVGLARNHPFVDGNKRIAFIAAGAFLRLNGHRLTADKVDAYRTFIALADGSLSEALLAEWIRRNSAPV